LIIRLTSSIFDEHFEFWRKGQFLTKISIFEQNFEFWRKCQFLTKISIFDENFDFWLNVIIIDQNLVQNFYFQKLPLINIFPLRWCIQTLSLVIISILRFHWLNKLYQILYISHFQTSIQFYRRKIQYRWHWWKI